MIRRAHAHGGMAISSYLITLMTLGSFMTDNVVKEDTGKGDFLCL